MNRHYKLYKKIFSIVAVAVMTAVMVAATVGCSFIDDIFGSDTISFSESTIALQVGESYDLTDIIETESSSYALGTSDGKVVTVNSNTRVITAVGEGVAYVTAKTDTDSARLKVSVVEKQPDSLSLTVNGEAVQTLGHTSEISFNATATGSLVKYTTVTWYVNGRVAKLLDKTVPFTFLPTEAGEYSVYAICGGYRTEASIVRVYNYVTAEVSVSGKIEQDGEPFTNVTFTVAITDGHNDSNYYAFYEDGKPLYEGENNSFIYSPNAGRHVITVYVNGIEAERYDCCFRGAVVPTPLGVEFDNLYPHVYFKYDAMGKVCVEITMQNGTPAEYSQDDPKYTGLFDENGFDIGKLIELCAISSTRRSYKLRIKSLGDGDALIESGYSSYISIEQLPSAAKKYLSAEASCGDHYITSETEYVALVEHYVYFRKKEAYSSVKFDCYIGYRRIGTAKDLWNEAFPIAATSGLYNNIVVNDIGKNEMHTEFTVSTANVPSRQTADSSNDYAIQLHAVLPHINYDANKYRPRDNIFPIDRRTRTVSVEYSDELYLAAQNNAKPFPKTGSAAEKLYARARKILRQICTEDMTDVQKAHAIYDWIMWQVTYDTPATEVKNNGASYSAYYLEGVFGDGATSFGGKVYSPYAVCDGMSKAYSLMCNIEGIPCVRVVGKAGKSLGESGGHAWNKVYVADNWYIVDCTWGDSHSRLSLDGLSGEYELGMHDHLFVTDSQTYDDHFEPFRYETSIKYAPSTAETPYNIYKELSFNGETINCYIAENENQTERLREIAVAFATAYEQKGSIYVPGGINNGQYKLNYQAIEVKAEGGFDISDSVISSNVRAAISSVTSLNVKLLTLNDTLIILVR